jgi:hypothetical protein
MVFLTLQLVYLTTLDRDECTSFYTPFPTTFPMLAEGACEKVFPIAEIVFGAALLGPSAQ